MVIPEFVNASTGHNKAEIVGPVGRKDNIIREIFYQGSYLVLDS